MWTLQLTGKSQRTNVRAAKRSSWQYLLVTSGLRASVQTSLPGSSKVYGIEVRHLADEKAVIKILDASLQKESSKYALSILGQKSVVPRMEPSVHAFRCICCSAGWVSCLSGTRAATRSNNKVGEQMTRLLLSGFNDNEIKSIFTRFV